MRRTGPAAAGLVAAVGAGTAYRLRGALPDSVLARFRRTNHAGEEVTLLEGAAFVLGASVGAVPSGPGPLLATTAAGLLGGVDDLAGDSSSKGLRGHLGALRHGRLTTGSAKVLGLAVSGLAAAALVDRRSRRAAGGHLSTCGPGAVGTLLGGAVIAGSANLVNLLDLRPGRALKASQLASVALLVRPSRPGAAAAGAALGAAAALLGPDLREEAMLGDTGANAAGALLGAAFVERSGTRGRFVALAVLTALTLASERVSFTQVIESTPGLRELDALGRRRR